MFRYLHVSIASAAVSVLLLATFSTGALAAEKKNPAGKEAVERFLLGKYTVTTFSPGRGPAPGGVVVQIMKQGLESSPAHTITPVFSYKDGRLRKSLATNALKDLAPIPFQSRMYITKIEARDNHILFDLVTTEAFDGVWFKSALHVEMGKTYLDNPNIKDIDATIGEVLMIEQQQQQAPPPGPGPRNQPPPSRQPTSAPPPPPTRVVDEPPPPPPPPPPPSSDPIVINPGMSSDQVKAALGPPVSANKFGAKEILVYPKMKVTLVNGKVTDVQ